MVHAYIFGVHNRHPGTIINKTVVDVIVIMGEHKMQSIADIFSAGIPHYQAVGNKFEIDPIAMPHDGIVHDLHTVTFPEMNTIPGIGFCGTDSFNSVISHYALLSLVAIDSKMCIIQRIAEYGHPLTAIDFNTGQIV